MKIVCASSHHFILQNKCVLKGILACTNIIMYDACYFMNEI